MKEETAYELTFNRMPCFRLCAQFLSFTDIRLANGSRSKLLIEHFKIWQNKHKSDNFIVQIMNGMEILFDEMTQMSIMLSANTSTSQFQ